MSFHHKTIDLHGLALVEDEPIHHLTLRNLDNFSQADIDPSSSFPHLDPALKQFTNTVYALIKHHVFQSTRGFKSLLISGDWGTGKTSVLGELATKLGKAEEGNNRFPTKTIFFEAWKYEQEANLMFALLWKLVSSAENYQEVLKSISTDSRSAVGEMFDYTISVGSQWSMKAGLKGLIEDRKAIQNYRRTKGTSEFLPDYISTDKFLMGFENLLKKLYPERKLVILIDDLDRCSPESAMNLLDNMRQLINGVSDQNCCFVVAMDKITLQQAIRHKFAELSSYDSNRYLEKLFPITLQLPAVQLSTQAFCQVQQAPLHSSPNDIDEIFQASFFQNARLFKRCMNQLWTFCLAKGTSSQHSPVDDRGRLVKGSDVSLTLVEWLAAINRWPELRRIIHKDDSYWDRIQTMFEGRTEHQGEVLRVNDAEIDAFLAQPGIKHFLMQSTVFGSIFSETNLYRRVQAYAAVERELCSVGI